MTLNRLILVFTTLMALTLPPASLAAPTMLVTPEESAASDAADSSGVTSIVGAARLAGGSASAIRVVKTRMNRIGVMAKSVYAHGGFSVP